MRSVLDTPLLRELQLQVMEALYEGRPAKAATLIEAPKPEARARLNVYRNNVQANFEEALAASYPVIRRLVGEVYFRQLVRAFRIRHASHSGDLQLAGERFAHYLAEMHHSGEHRYLADVAHLEWQIQAASGAPDTLPLNLAELARVELCDHPRLQFKLHPALRLFRSPYPILNIWEANIELNREPDRIDLNSGADQLIVLRRASRLRFHRLDANEYLFLLDVEKGAAFGAVVDSALSRDPDFDVAITLQRCVAINAIVGFDLAQEMP